MQIFLADGRDGTNEPTEGSTRGPRGPKKVSLDTVDTGGPVNGFKYMWSTGPHIFESIHCVQ